MKRGNWAWFGAACLGLLWGGARASASPKIWSDSKGMPRCLSLSDRQFNGGLLIRPISKNLYRRGVETLVLEEQDRFAPLDGTYVPQFKNCRFWEELTQHYDRAQWRKLKDGSTKVGVYHFDDRTLAQLDQIRRGANVARSPDQTASRIIYEQRLTHDAFDRETNRKLAAKYGMEFVTKVYGELVDQSPRAQAFEAAFDSVLRDAHLLSASTDFVNRMANVEILAARELGHPEDANSGEVARILEGFRSSGLSARPLRQKSYGTLVHNTNLIAADLKETLDRGKDVILLGVSKGVPEMLAALAQLHGVATKGRVLGVVSLVGVIDGSMMADRWGADTLMPPLEFINWAVGRFWKPANQTFVRAFFDLKTEKVRRHMKPASSGKLPQDAVYVSVVATPPWDYALAKDVGMRVIQEKAAFPVLPHGANDGYLEYPATEIPYSWAPKSYLMHIQASHTVLVDGTYRGWELKRAQDQNQWMLMTLRTVMRLADPASK